MAASRSRGRGWQVIVALRLARDQAAFFRSLPHLHLPGLSEIVAQMEAALKLLGRKRHAATDAVVLNGGLG